MPSISRQGLRQSKHLFICPPVGVLDWTQGAGKAVPGQLERPLLDPLPQAGSEFWTPTAGSRGRGIPCLESGTQDGARTARLPWAGILRPYGAEKPALRASFSHPLRPARKMRDTISPLERGVPKAGRGAASFED